MPCLFFFLTSAPSPSLSGKGKLANSGNCLVCNVVNSTEGEQVRRDAWPLLAALFPPPSGQSDSAQDSSDCSPTQS